MPVFSLNVPGYVTVPSQGGPDVFNNVFNLGWTDQQGLRSPTNVRFNGKGGLPPVDFHIPFTAPTLFTAETAGTAVRMQIASVAIFFFSDPRVLVNRIRVFDGLTLIFDTLSTVGPLGLSGFAFNNTSVLGRNLHGIGPPGGGITLFRGVGVTVTVDFGVNGGIVGFTRAGIRLEA